MDPKELKYTKGHTWVKTEGNVATVGLSDYAQAQLGSILLVEPKSVGDAVTAGKTCGSIESDKATSDIMSPVSGKIVEVNEEAVDAPEKVNEDPYGEGWVVKVEMSDPGEINSLMSADEFEEFIK